MITSLFNENSNIKECKLPWEYDILKKDLELEKIFDIMGGEDNNVRNLSIELLFNPVNNENEMYYRQNTIKDALNNQKTVINMYKIILNAINEAKKNFLWMSENNPSLSIMTSKDIINTYIDSFKKLRDIAISEKAHFNSKGFAHLFNLILEEFNEEYLDKIKNSLNQINTEVIYASGKIGDYSMLSDFKLLTYKKRRVHLPNIVSIKNKHYTYTLPPRDIAGAEAIADLKKKILYTFSGILKDSAKNILGFMKSLNRELGMLIGCINLYNKITELNLEVCFPEFNKYNEISYESMYDLSLALRIGKNIVNNSIENINSKLIFITGANRGGKSTFLRGVGQCILLMGAGLYVPATKFNAKIYEKIFTHFKREEDPELKMGKFGEELKRLNGIIDHVKKGSIILFNESFSSTDALEGSYVASEIIDALKEKNIDTIFVTHFYELPYMYIKRGGDTVFLKAERTNTGERTYKIIKGKPEDTGYAIDLFKEIFNNNIIAGK